MVKTQRKVTGDMVKHQTDFEYMYQQHIKQVYRYLFSITRNVQDAEDITAQTFMVAYESLHRLRDASSLKSWIFRIARNKAMDHFRKRTKIATGELPSLPVDDDPLSEMIQSEKIRALSSIMKSLSEDEIELLRLRFLAQMTFAEMAEFLSKKEDAVKKSVYRLIERLQKQVEGSYE